VGTCSEAPSGGGAGAADALSAGAQGEWNGSNWIESIGRSGSSAR
jgi:hypothetical protein